jgi:glutathione S-transferase
MYRLFSWEHSYFSGKVRAYLRFKARQGALGDGFEDILATPELIAGLLTSKSGSGAVPQIQAPDGTWIQDSSDIIDYCEAAHPEMPICPNAQTSPRQRLAAYLIEFLADEWIVVPAFWQRWFFSEDGREPSHRAFNEQQWGAAIAAGAPGDARRAAGAGFFEAAFGISTSRSDPKGVYAGLVHLGCDEKTEHAWQASQHSLLEHLEAHFAKHDYLLGGRPSLADYGLIGPLYAHLYRDAVPGFYLRTHFPLTAEWVERTNGEGALNARVYGQKLYSLNDSGELVGRGATSDDGQWLPDDAIPDTLMPILGVFFDEMWPTLRSASERLRAYAESEAHSIGDELPGKTFTATPGFFELQLDGGALTHAFDIGGIESRRMVVPYQVWMWQRICTAMQEARADPESSKSVDQFLSSLGAGSDFFDIGGVLGKLRIRKEGARLYSESA